jgi:hypothetical protein
MGVFDLYNTSPTAAWVNITLSLMMFVVFLFCMFQTVRLTIKLFKQGNESSTGNKNVFYALAGFISICAAEYFVKYPFQNLYSVFLVLKMLLIINAIVFIHEMGHYLAARVFKVNVEEFSIGMGPKIFGFKMKNTIFNLKVLPGGGFVRPNQQEAVHLKLVPKLIFFLAGIFLTS